MVNKRNQGSSYDSSFKIGSGLINKKNKRGWIRIIEALIVVLLILGFVILLINPAEEEKKLSSKVYATENAILREIQMNNTYRDYILSVVTSVEFENFNSNLKNHIIKRIPEYLECTGKICDFGTDPICDIELENKNIYVRSVMIAAKIDDYDPKEIKLFCWTV